MKNHTLNNSTIIFSAIIILAMLINFLTARDYGKSNRMVAAGLSQDRYFSYEGLYSAMEGSFPGEGHLVIDLRSREEFQKRHIPGAVNIPAGEIPDRKNKKMLRKSDSILLYAGSEELAAGCRVLLHGMGIENVSLIPGNYQVIKERVLNGFDPSYAFYNEDKTRWEYQRFMPVGKSKRESRDALRANPDPEVPTPVIGGC